MKLSRYYLTGLRKYRMQKGSGGWVTPYGYDTIGKLGGYWGSLNGKTTKLFKEFYSQWG